MILNSVAAEGSTETFSGVMEHVAQGFEALGAAILVAGVIWSFVLAAMAARRSGWSAKVYLVLRQAFGGTLLLGLEVLVAADLVRTVAVAPTLNNVLWRPRSKALHRGGGPWPVCTARASSSAPTRHSGRRRSR